MTADQQKQIRFVGSFQDNITPAIKRINQSINLLNGSMRHLYRTTMSVSGAFIQLSATFSTSLDSLRDYRAEIIRTARSYSLLTSRANRPLPPIPPPPIPPGGGGGGGFSLGGNLLRAEILGGLITNAITAGFNYGADLIRKVFGNVFGSIQERMQDQMSDIQSAGGIFALAQGKSIKAFGDTFDDALGFQRELNAELSRVAASLPGSTSDYVRTAKGLTDGLMTTIGKDAVNFQKAFGSGTGDLKDSMKDALAQLTTKGVLLGQGQTGGIPLPVLLERILSQEKVNVKAMGTTFAALEQNPLLKNALEEAEKEINATGASTAARLKVVIKTLDKALPAEQINAMRRATLGVMEAYRSFFQDPESGLFGLGRSIKIGKKKVKEYSSSTGLQTGLGESISLFEVLNDIFANVAVVFAELLPVIQEIWDPLKGITTLFLDFRESSFNLFAKFNGASKVVTALAKKYGVDIDKYQAGIRSSILAISQWLRDVGALSNDAFKSISTVALGKSEISSEKLKEIVTTLGQSFITSDWLKGLSEAFGRAAAKVIVGIRDFIAGVSNLAQDNTALGALFRGFQQEGGGEALRDIFSSLFRGIVKFTLSQIKEMFSRDPLGVSLTLAAIYTVLNPASVIGWLFGGLGKILTIVGGKIIASGIYPVLATIAVSLGQAFMGILAAIPAVPVLVIGAIAVLFHYLKEPFLKVLSFLQSGADSLYSKAPGWVQALLMPFKVLLVEFPLSVLETLTNLLASVGKLIIGIFTLNTSTIKESFEDFTFMFQDMWGQFNNFILDKFGWMLDRFGIEWERYNKESERASRRARRRNEDAMNSSFDFIGPQIPSGGFPSSSSSPSFGGKATTGKYSGSTPADVNAVTGVNTFKSTLAGMPVTFPGKSGYNTIRPGDWDALGAVAKAGFQFTEGHARNLGLSISQGRRHTWHNSNSWHYKNWGVDGGGALDVDTEGDHDKRGIELFHRLLSFQGKGLWELFYNPTGMMVKNGKLSKGQVPGHFDHLHVAFKNPTAYNGHLSPLMEEARNMPGGASLMVANNSEAVMNREQIRGMFEGISGGNGVTIHNLVVNGDNARQLAEQVVAEIDKAIQNRRKRSALA